MDDMSRGEQLIQKLLSDSSTFYELGTANELLNEYFDGFPLETLRPLLKSDDFMVRRAATFVTSELSVQASSLIRDVLPLVTDIDRHIRYNVIETIFVCSASDNSENFFHVIRALQDHDEVIRVLAMDLISKANTVQLETGIRMCKEADRTSLLHREGLGNLTHLESLTLSDLMRLVEEKESLTRKYAVIAARRNMKKFSELIDQATLSSDDDVRKFAERVQRIEGP